MCYSQLCPFQDRDGDCTISGHDAFRERFVHSPCIIAGTPWSEEDEEYIKELEHNLAFQYVRNQLFRMSGWQIYLETRKVKE